MRKHLVAKSRCYSYRRARRKILRHKGACKPDNSKRDEYKTPVYYIRNVTVLDTDVHNGFYDYRHKQIKARLKQLEKGCYKALQLMTLQKLKNRLHYVASKQKDLSGARIILRFLNTINYITFPP
jgi:hypothetical protein